MRQFLSLMSITVSAFLSACGNTGQINDALSGTLESLRDCNDLALQVLLTSYEKAGENQGRHVSFTSMHKFNRVEEDGVKWFDLIRFSVNSDGKIVKTSEGVFPSPGNIDYRDADPRIQSKTRDSLTCSEYFDKGEGNIADAILLITKDRESLRWRNNN